MPSIGSGVKIDFVLRASRCLTFYRAWRVSASSEGRNLDAISPQRCARKNGPPTPSQHMAGRGPAWKVRPNTWANLHAQDGFVE